MSIGYLNLSNFRLGHTVCFRNFLPTCLFPDTLCKTTVMACSLSFPVSLSDPNIKVILDILYTLQDHIEQDCVLCPHSLSLSGTTWFCSHPRADIHSDANTKCRLACLLPQVSAHTRVLQWVRLPVGTSQPLSLASTFSSDSLPRSVQSLFFLPLWNGHSSKAVCS